MASANVKIKTMKTNTIKIKKLSTYERKVRAIIRDRGIFTFKKITLTPDILIDGLDLKEDRIRSTKIKHIQMAAGKYWQIILGNWYGYRNLGSGHDSYLNFCSSDGKMVIELKNRTNTVNSGSQKSMFNNFVKYSKAHPKCKKFIWGCVNGSTAESISEGSVVKYEHRGLIIYRYTGFKLFKLIFGDDAKHMVKFARKMFLENSKKLLSKK